MEVEQFVEVLNRKSLGLIGSQKVMPKADLGRIRELVPEGWELHVKDGEVVMKRSASP